MHSEYEFYYCRHRLSGFFMAIFSFGFAGVTSGDICLSILGSGAVTKNQIHENDMRGEWDCYKGFQDHITEPC